MEKEQPANGAEVITLAFHVNYWDYLGWKDPFASELFTQRQAIYGQKFGLPSVYTPQMVVDGTFEFTGSDSNRAMKAIAEARKSSKANIGATLSENKLKVEISKIPEHKGASVYLSIVEDDLETNVRRGENAGKKLAHISVVRELKSIGIIKTGDKVFAAEADLSNNPAWRQEHIRLVIFIQENASRKILGINRIVSE